MSPTQEGKKTGPMAERRPFLFQIKSINIIYEAPFGAPSLSRT
jgi:hypothetical protein